MSASRPSRSLPSVFAYGFRPFFLLAGWWALLAIGAWLWMFPAAGAPLPGMLPQHWHGHEMLFGFVGAAIAGFLLTAVPSWTGGRGFAGWPLILLVVTWVAGRLAFAAGGAIPAWLFAAGALVFLPALGAVIAPALMRATNRNTPLLGVLLALWLADAAFVYGALSAGPGTAALALLAGLDVVLLLITVIGGRIVPAFTANALRRRGIEPAVRSRPWLERAVIAAMALVLAVDILLPASAAAATVALAAGALQAVRLAGWNGRRTLSDPLVWVLHLGYLWLPLGLLLKAAWLGAGAAWAAHWLHALGAGAAATMILAVMSRAALGHTGRPLEASRTTAAGYALLALAVAVRVFGPALLPIGYVATVRVAGLLWIAAFLVFVTVYTPILLRPRADGRPG